MDSFEENNLYWNKSLNNQSTLKRRQSLIQSTNSEYYIRPSILEGKIMFLDKNFSKFLLKFRNKLCCRIFLVKVPILISSPSLQSTSPSPSPTVPVPNRPQSFQTVPNL